MATADSHEAPASLTAAAVRGSVLNTGQWVANKVATAAAMLLIARMLRPEEYGVATQALAIAQFLVVLTPVSVGDVLIAHPSRLEMLAPSARALALRVGLAMAGVVLVSIPVVVTAYSRYPALALGGLVALLSIRPVLDALTVVPVSRLRTGLHYRRIALVDGLVQLAMTGVSLAMAAFGGRGASLVAPQLIGTGVRALVYGRSAADRPGARVHGWAIRALWQSLLPAALAQYVHNVVVLLEILVLGLVSGELQTGLFGFAFLLAAQANQRRVLVERNIRAGDDCATGDLAHHRSAGGEVVGHWLARPEWTGRGQLRLQPLDDVAIAHGQRLAGFEIAARPRRQVDARQHFGPAGRLAEQGS